jgi:small subunit ribosomal protein S12
MPTLIQLMKKKRRNKTRTNYKGALDKCPQKTAMVLKAVIRKPKKPNSARRLVAIVRIYKPVKRVPVYFPGGTEFGGSKLQNYAQVLIRGGRVRDLPGVRYKIIRGALDINPPVNRKNRRSLYGVWRGIVIKK